MKTKVILRSLLVIIGLLLSINIHAQIKWEPVPLTSYKWQISNDLSVYSNSIQQLEIANLNAPSEKNKKNNIVKYFSATLDLNWKDNKPFEISFNIVNKNNNPYSYKYRVYERDRKGKLKEKWYQDNIYWGIFFELYGSGGNIVTNRILFYASKGSYKTNFGQNVNDRGWESNVFEPDEVVYIKKETESSLGIVVGRIPVGRWDNITGIKSISILVGAAASISVTNFHIKKYLSYDSTPTAEYNRRWDQYTGQTQQSTSSHPVSSLSATDYVRKGDEYAEKKMHTDAILQYNNAIDKGYKNAIDKGYKNATIYIKRAWCFALKENYSLAMQDCNIALSYDNQNQGAYYLRGICKFNNDDSGIDDLWKAGKDGIAFMTEFGLLDYNPNTFNPQKQRQVPQNILKKDPNFKIK